MAYMLIIDNENKKIEIHSDMCDVVFDKKEELFLDPNWEFIPFHYYSEIEEYLNNTEDFEVVECEICKPVENKESLDEDYDDIYEEFDEDEDYDDTRCDII
ncbi:hypothetical protein C3L23_00940 [Nautilia sp. PV-1]|uniref:hypothetical protein n=1 Tax=Nautilia sp. PV-1 TaxID=2579250 RepID=UPI000FDC400A|nr:hypothetical protein [Nautilia sp. PV-1]AZV45881.1 hypothetical protein C3L23_00940 [Nautilia sp. PV-1]